VRLSLRLLLRWRGISKNRNLDPIEVQTFRKMLSHKVSVLSFATLDKSSKLKSNYLAKQKRLLV